MLYQISHTTTYQYSEPIVLNPHTIRLRPRSNGWQTLQMFSLLITPAPISQSELIELDGNAVMKAWFQAELTEQLTVQVLSQVATHQTNPFNYLLELWALKLPIEYPPALLKPLQPYLGKTDNIVLQLAQEIRNKTSGNPTNFLCELNSQIHQSCEYTIRETGEPLPASVTWTEKQGSCRDLTVLFIEACRAIGLAARFVSGYHEGDPDIPENHLHAWAEVYLPGAGWRGYDPTLGLAVSDRHIALAASTIPEYAAPIAGTVGSNSIIQSTMSYDLQIQQLGF